MKQYNFSAKSKGKSYAILINNRHLIWYIKLNNSKKIVVEADIVEIYCHNHSYVRIA